MKYLFLAIISIAPFFAYSQSNFRNGYVVTNAGDTLKGQIDYKERMNNPEAFVFKSASDGSIRTMSVADCRGYGITDMEISVRAIVNISLSEVSASKIAYGIDTTFRRDTVFLRVLQTGKYLTLLSYADKIKERFYLQGKTDPEPVELIRNIYFKDNETNKVSENNRYIRQVYTKMIELDPEIQGGMDKLRNLKYTRSSLIKQVSIINETEVQRPKYASSRLFLGVGLNVAKGAYDGVNDLSNSAATTKTSYLPMVSGGIDFFINPAIQKTILRAEVFLLKSNSEISVNTTQDYKAFLSHSFEQISAVITPQVLHNFYNKDKFKIFAGIGAGINLVKTINNKSIRDNTANGTRNIIENAVDLKGFSYTLMGRVGLVLNKKLEISVAYWPEMPISDYIAYNVTMRRTTMGLNYIFGK